MHSPAFLHWPCQRVWNLSSSRRLSPIILLLHTLISSHALSKGLNSHGISCRLLSFSFSLKVACTLIHSYQSYKGFSRQDHHFSSTFVYVDAASITRCGRDSEFSSIPVHPYYLLCSHINFCGLSVEDCVWILSSPGVRSCLPPVHFGGPGHFQQYTTCTYSSLFLLYDVRYKKSLIVIYLMVLLNTPRNIAS